MSKTTKKKEEPKIASAEDATSLEKANGRDPVEAQLNFTEESKQEINSLIPSKMFVITGTSPSVFITNEKVGFVRRKHPEPEDFEKKVERGDLPPSGEIKVKIIARYEKVGKFRRIMKPIIYQTLIGDTLKKRVYWDIGKRYTALPVFELDIPEGYIAKLEVNPKFKELGIISYGNESIKGPFQGRIFLPFHCENGLLIAIDVPWYSLKLKKRKRRKKQ